MVGRGETGLCVCTCSYLCLGVQVESAVEGARGWLGGSPCCFSIRAPFVATRVQTEKDASVGRLFQKLHLKMCLKYFVGDPSY